jgi:DNA-binding FadR family transcriptional regulator
MFRPVARQRVYEDVVGQVEAGIRDGRFPAGAALPSERELAAMLGVGRVAVREALHSLHERGLVEIRHGRKARVQAPSSALLAPRLAGAAEHVLATFGERREDLLEARILFESAMARIAAERGSDDEIAALERALARNRAAVDRDGDYLASDLALHRAIAAMSHNALFEAISDGMLGWLERYRFDLVSVPGANALSHREHARIVRRIAARDPEGAARAMTEHLTRSNALYRKPARRTSARPRTAARPHGRGRVTAVHPR